MSKDIKKMLEMLDNSHSTKLNENINSTQMVFQHYQDNTKQIKTNKTSVLDKYFKLAEEELIQRQLAQRDSTIQRARLIAEQLQPTEPKVHNKPVTDAIDVVTLDVPLLIRLLEYAREDAKTDMDLHDVANNMIKLSKKLDVLDMSCYKKIVPTRKKEL